MAHTSQKSLQSKQNGFSEKSRIVHGLNRFSDYMSRLFAESGIGALLTLPFRHLENSDNPQIKRTGSPLMHRMVLPIKRFVNRQTAESPTATWLSRLGSGFLRIKFRNLGFYYFSFGLLLSILYIVDRFALEASFSNHSLYIGIAAMILSAIGCVSSKTVAEEIENSRIMGYIIYRLIGFRRTSRKKEEPISRGGPAIILGIATALLTRLTSLTFGLLMPPFLLIGYIILTLPEAGLVVLCLSLLFFPLRHLSYYLVFLMAAWFFKWIQGKRLMTCTILDRAVLTFGFLMFLAVIVCPADFRNIKDGMLTMVVPIVAYFAAANLNRSINRTEFCCRALLFSHTVITCFALIFMFCRRFIPALTPTDFPSPILSTLTEICTAPHVLSRLYVLMLPLIIAVAGAEENQRSTSTTALLILSAIVALFAISKGGWIALLSALLLYWAIGRRKAITHLAWLIGIFPICTACIPAFGLNFWTDFNEGIHLLETKISESGIMMNFLRDFGLSGIGYGNEAISTVIPYYHSSASGEEFAANVLTRLTAVLGIPGLICFILIMICFISRSIVYFKSCHVDEPRRRTIAAGGFAAVMGFTVGSFFDYSFLDPRLILVYFLIMGMTTGLMNAAENERIITRIDSSSLELTLSQMKGWPTP